MASDRLWKDRDKKVVVLDSSAIMMLFEFSIDLEYELALLVGKFHIVLPKPIFDELKFLSEHGKGKKRRIAKPALELTKHYEILEAEGKGDDSVLFLAQKLDGVIVTNDRNLKQRAKEKCLKTIYLRSKKKLVLD